MRVCPVPGCPTLTRGGRCTEHQVRSQASSDSRTWGHRKERKRVAAHIASGTATCSRCGAPIRPGDAWHLDHTDDRTGYLGPSCATCNTSAGGRAAHRPGG